MKKFLLLITIFVVSFNIFSQSALHDESEKVNSITVGILQGGGSLIGFDFEMLLTDQVGLQVGAGLLGFGAGFNFHFKPSIRSSFLSFTYWNQGTGDRFVQNAVGPTFVYRSKKWFTFQIGFGFPLSEGPAFPEKFEQPPIMLLYSIGAYFPL